MRLVNTRTLRLEEFFDASTPDYAILSHTWAQDEVIFSDMTDLGKARTKIGFAKLEGACRLAATQKYDYIWIDTCCIDKSSSAELSEAINSMYRWYEKAKVCYAYLCDVKNPTQLVGCKWFTRGWTLQELLAPDDVEFYTLDWVYLGNKRDPSLIPTLSRASLVDAPVLARVIQPWDVSVAKRMYWASSRETTRREDEAYCMMGLFRVNMPLLYGEGSKAFFRLQQEIAKDTHDQSILAWYCEPRRETELARRVGTRSEIDFGCCAPSPSCFAMSGDITSSSAPSPEGSLGQIIFTGPGTEFLAPLKGGDENWSHEDDWKAENETWWDEREIILRCQVGPIPGTFPTLVVVQAANRGQYYRRNLTHGIVSSVSLYTFPSHVEEPNRIRSARRNKIGLQIFAPTTPVNGSSGVATVEGEMRQKVRGKGFPVQRVTIMRTVISAPTETKTGAGHWQPLAPATFWLLPLAAEQQGSKILASVMDVFPIHSWDRSSHQFFWVPKQTTNHGEGLRPMPLGGPITVGVACIRINFPIEDPGARTEGPPRTAILIFGLRKAKRQNANYPHGLPWCHLIHGGDDAGAGLERYLTSPIADEDRTLCASLAIEDGVALKAAINETVIFGNLCFLTKLWIVVPGSQSRITVVGSPRQILLGGGERAESLHGGGAMALA